MSECPSEVYIAVRPDHDVPPHKWPVFASCNGPQDCGFDVPFLDENGDLVINDEPFSITSGEMTHYVELHQQHANGR